MRQDTPESLVPLFKDGLTKEEYEYYKRWLLDCSIPERFHIYHVMSHVVITYHLAASLLHNMEREGIIESEMTHEEPYRMHWRKRQGIK